MSKYVISRKAGFKAVGFDLQRENRISFKPQIGDDRWNHGKAKMTLTMEDPQSVKCVSVKIASKDIKALGSNIITLKLILILKTKRKPFKKIIIMKESHWKMSARSLVPLGAYILNVIFLQDHLLRAHIVICHMDRSKINDNKAVSNNRVIESSMVLKIGPRQPPLLKKFL